MLCPVWSGSHGWCTDAQALTVDGLLFQRAAFAHFPELYDFSLSNVAEVDARDSLVKFFGPLR